MMEEAEDHVLIARNDFQGLRKVLNFAQGYRWSLVAALAVLVIGSAMAMVSANVLGQLAEKLGAISPGQEGVSTVLPFVFLLLSLEGLTVFLRWFGGISLARSTNKLILGLRLSMFEKMARLPISYFDKQPLGRIITRLTGDVEGIEQLFAASLSRILDALIKIVAVLIAMIVTQPRFGLIIVAFSLPAATLNMFTKKIILYWMREQKKRVATVNSRLAEFMNGFGVVKILGLEKWTKQVFHNAAIDYFNSQRALMNINTIVMPITVFLCAIPVIAVLYFGGNQVLSGALSVATFVTFLRYTEYFLNPVRVLSSEIQQIQNALSSSERVRKTLEEREETDELGPSGTKTSCLKGGISFCSVSMGYDRETDVLSNVSFEIRPGERVGLVGRTGSGKTTAVSLLTRLYEFQSGDIKLDGISIRDFDRQALRLQMGFVTQEVIMFRGTLRENLSASCVEKPTDEAILLATTQSGLTELIQKLPSGLDTMVLDGGSNFSAGERQLINFTRVLIRNPAIMILDEATANVDERSEEILHTALEAVMANRTCLIIAHRLSTVSSCDKLLVFDGGKLVESGSPKELLDQKGHYFHLVSRQRSS